MLDQISSDVIEPDPASFFASAGSWGRFHADAPSGGSTAASLLATSMNAQLAGPKINFDPVAMSVAATLILMFLFTISIFYVANHRDKDIRRVTWFMFSYTVSIFLAIQILCAHCPLSHRFL